MLSSVALNVAIENLSPEGGLSVTPVWVGFHDGRFDIGSRGIRADEFAGLEALAEEGDTSGLSERFAQTTPGVDATVAAPDGFPGAPVFEPGEVVSQVIDVEKPGWNRYFSFATMVIPSNDAFLANLNPRAYRLFNAHGDFRGPLTIDLYGRDVWDAGTEVNDPAGGAAFSTEGGTAVDENGRIHRHTGLDDFISTGLPTGEELQSAFIAQTPLARITISLASDPVDPIDHRGPEATLVADDITDSDVTFHEFQVIYSDPSGVAVDSIDTSDLRVVRYGGRGGSIVLHPTSVTTDAGDADSARTVTATYRVEAPGGTFDPDESGRYRVELVGDRVSDTLSNQARRAIIGGFDVLVPTGPAEILVTVENLSPEGGLLATPFWLGVHDGRFDLGSSGRPASFFPGLEALAEEGDTSGISQRFGETTTGVDATLAAPDGFPGAPVFEPNEAATQSLLVSDPHVNRYFSFASMVIPSNDAFLANLNSRAVRLFNSFGHFLGARTIELYGGDVWDAGTEVNDPAGGAAFTTAGGVSADENGVIHPHTGLDDFIGGELPTGETLQSAFSDQTPLARITISLASNPSDPVDRRGPIATLSAEDVTEPGISTHQFEVTYSDASGIDVNSIDASDIRVVRPGGPGGPITLIPTLVETDAAPGTSPRTVVATYSIEAPDGEFDPLDSGQYQVQLVGRVDDVSGNRALRFLLGTFLVDVPEGPTQLRVDVENLSPDGGLYLTPFWVGIHDGGFDLGTPYRPASAFPGLEALAEEGVTGEISSRFHSTASGVDTTITSPDGFPGAPVFDPGEVAGAVLDIDDPGEQRYFSFASMVIPSNDAFLANLNARAHRVFDAHGNFLGPMTIELFGRDVWDAGTEVNDPFGGAAFSTEGGEATDENGVVRSHAGLDEFIGTGLPTGELLQSAFVGITPLARITISLATDPSPPIDNEGPQAMLISAPDVTTTGVESYQFQILYTDPSGIDVSTIDTSTAEAVRVGGSGGTIVLQPTEVTTDAAPGTNPVSVIATYTVPAPGGVFEPQDSGTYRIYAGENKVADTMGNEHCVRLFGSFEVDVPPGPFALEVEIENLAVEGGLYQTPFWVGVHDGEFDLASRNRSADRFPGLEALAEEGITSELSQYFQDTTDGVDTTILAPDGFPGAPVLEPGEIAIGQLQVDDPRVNRYFSFASMVIPSNDAFLANLNPREHRLFDGQGIFVGPITITLYGRDILDAGTEVNDPSGGAAFSTEGGVSQDENGTINVHHGLDDFVGTGIPPGGTLQTAFDSRTPIARITIRPAAEPADA